MKFEPAVLDEFRQAVREVSVEEGEDVSVGAVVRRLVEEWLRSRRADKTEGGK